MNYCRFSSDNWKSDVYVCDAGSSKVIHVAVKKRLIPPQFQNYLFHSVLHLLDILALSGIKANESLNLIPGSKKL